MHNQLQIQYKHLLLFFVVCICVSTLDGLVYEFKYIKYIIAPVAICFWLAGGGFARNNLNLSPLVFSFILIMTWGGITLLWNYHELGFKDAVFISSYTIPILLFYTKGININTIFYVFICFFILSLPTKEMGSFSISDSTTFYESADSFVFGTFLLYFFMKRRYVMSFISFVLLLVTLKRIALLGVIICIACLLLPKKIQKYILSTPSLIAINILAVTMIILIGSGSLDEAFHILTGKGSSEFTLGRVFHYQGVIEDIFANPDMLLFGNGIGSAYSKAMYYYSGDIEYANLHSDTLKILYEYGLIVFTLFFFLLSKCKTIEGRTIILYVSLLFITDNVFVYVGVMFFVILILLVAETNSKNYISLRTNQTTKIT